MIVTLVFFGAFIAGAAAMYLYLTYPRPKRNTRFGIEGREVSVRKFREHERKRMDDRNAEAERLDELWRR